MRHAVIAILLVLTLAAGFYLGAITKSTPAENVVDDASLALITSSIGLTQINVSMTGNTAVLTGNCKAVQFEVTSDQAYSISLALTNTSSQRPLTHDILLEMAENFGVELVQVNIDRYEEDIYKATIYMKRGKDVLGLDARPSDSIAITARKGIPLYMKTSILNDQGLFVC